MLRPFLLIGIGGSGGKTLRVIHDTLKTRLEAAGWPTHRELPAAWQFLQVDVATVVDGDDPDLPPQLPPASFLGMVGSGVDYTAMDTALALDLDPASQLESLGGWKPDARKVQVSIAKGAGQYRALGRVVALTRLEEIKTRVNRMVNAVTDAEVKGELDRAAELLGQRSTTHASAEPIVLVISSIAGGSGAGALMDVCDVVRSTGKPWMDASVGILYAPDVFDEIPAASRRGVRPNALSTLAELMSGYWSYEGRAGGVTEATANLYRSRKIETTAINRLGPRFPILVGARNADVAYGAQNQIYRGMGVAISEWMTSERLQDQMNSYVFGNWAQTAASVQDRLGLKLQHQETPFSAFGFARLSLGRDVFATYSSQYLARLAADRIRRQHLLNRVEADTRTDDELVAARADARFAAFLDKSGLDERGTEKNQIIDAIRPLERDELGRAWVASTLEAITKGVPVDGLTAAEWQQRVTTEMQKTGPRLLDDLRARRMARARDWVRDIQVSLSEHVTRWLAAEGGQVTLRLLTKLSGELETITRELPEERQQMMMRSEKARDEVSAQLSTGTARIPATAGGPVDSAVRRGANSLLYAAEADLITLVEQLVRDLRVGLLEPMSRAVEHGFQKLQQDAKATNGNPSPVDLWPSGDVIPPRLRPARNEFLLDDLDEFKPTLSRLLLQDSQADTPLGAEDAVAQAVITDSDGTVPGVAPRPRPMLRERDWQPSIDGMHDTSSTPSAARFRLDIGADDLLRRANEWIRNDQRSFGRYLAESLREHLDDPGLAPDVKARRIQRFAGQWRAALDRGKPLVNISTSMLSVVHDATAPSQQLIVSPLPLPRESDAARAAQEVLDSIAPGAAPELFGDAPGQSVSVFWVLSEPYEPIVFASLMEPIADEWADARMDSDARQAFWMWRRARTMPEFVPAAPAVRRAMIRGWITAVLLGQIRVPEPLSDAPVQIWTPGVTGGEGRWVDFPYPALKPYGSPADAIGSVLESLIVALLGVYSSQSLEPLLPYQRLRSLGSSGPSQGVEEYETLNQSIQRWIKAGEADIGAPVPNAERMGSIDDTPDVRRTRLEKRIDSIRSSYVERFAEIRQRNDVLGVPRDYELRQDVLAALDDIAGRLGQSSGGGDFT